jgi:hypothetical protein
LFGCQYYGSGKAADILFKTTGKEILKKKDFFEDPNAKEKEADILPSFVVGEKGHTNLHFRKGNQTTESIYRSDFIARHGNRRQTSG